MGENLQRQVEQSNSAEAIRQETIRVLEQAQEIFKIAEEKGENVDSIRQEYEDVRLATIEALKDDMMITESELSRIKLELSHLNKVSQSESDRSVFDRLAFIPQSIGITSELLEDLGIDTNDLNTNQDELIAEILGGEDKGYGNGYIKGHNSKIGNYISKISDFEEKLNNPNFYIFKKDLHNVSPNNDVDSNIINSREIANYLMYLNENGGVSKEILLQKFGIEKTKELISLWSNNGDTLAQNILREAGLGDIIEKINNINIFISLSPEEISSTIPLMSIPKEGYDLGGVDKNTLESFCNRFESTNNCPPLNSIEDYQKFTDILLKAKLENIDNKGRRKIHEKVLEIIKKSIDGEIPKELEDKINNFSNELYLSAIETIQKDSCSFELINFIEGELNLFIKREDISKYGIKFDFSDTKEVAGMFSLINLEQAETKVRHMEEYSDIYSQEEVEQAKENLEISKRINKITSNITEEQIKKYNELVKKQGKEKARKLIIQEIESDNIEGLVNSTTDAYSYSPETGTIEIPETKESITLSPEEQALAKDTPETLDNIVNFYKFFKELNLEGVWEYRKELTLAMGDVNININDDSLKKSELIRFANKLIDFLNNSLNTNLNENNISLSAIKSELRELTGAGSYFEGQTFNIQGEDILTANLRSLGIIGGACFHTMQFRDILDGKKVDKK